MILATYIGFIYYYYHLSSTNGVTFFLLMILATNIGFIFLYYYHLNSTNGVGIRTTDMMLATNIWIISVNIVEIEIMK